MTRLARRVDEAIDKHGVGVFLSGYHVKAVLRDERRRVVRMVQGCQGWVPAGPREMLGDMTKDADGGWIHRDELLAKLKEEK